MTASELEEQIDRAVAAFMEIEGMTEDLAQRLVEQGYLSYDDLSVIEPDALMEMGGMTAEQVDLIVEQADERAAAAEKVEEAAKRQKKELAAAGHVAQSAAAVAAPESKAVAEIEPEAAPEAIIEETPPSAETLEDNMDKNNDADQK